MATATEKSNNHPVQSKRVWNSPIERFFRNNFQDFWNGYGPETVPSLNIREETNNYAVDMAAPGLRKEDIVIDIDNHVLTISYEQESEHNDKDENDGYSHREYNYSQFSRSVTLPEDADGNNIKAQYTDGVLTVNIPKRAKENKEKKAKIKID